jgi:voltage-gated potassium channel
MEWGRQALAFGGLLVAFFAVPLGADVPTWRLVFGLILTFAAVSAAGLIISRQIRFQLSGIGRRVQFRGLLLLLEIVVVAFATAYFMIAESTNDQFAGIETRLDALYFTIVTLGTVGYGDVHAVGQAARGLVVVQIVFNIVFIGALSSLLASRIRDASSSRTQRSAADAADEDE